MQILLNLCLIHSFPHFSASLVRVGCVVSDVEVGPEVSLLVLDRVHWALKKTRREIYHHASNFLGISVHFIINKGINSVYQEEERGMHAQ